MKPLRFTVDRPFKVLQFTDVHWANGNALDLRTSAHMKKILRNERPDLVLLTGDTVNGEEGVEPMLLLPRALAPVIESGAPWAFVFGNHDTQWGTATKRELFDLARSLPNCVMAEPDGVAPDRFDQILPIYESAGDRPAWHIYLMDSGRDHYVYDHTTWGEILPAQIDWFKRRAAGISDAYGKISALMFMHIPMPEHEYVWDRRVCHGVKHEDVGCSNINNGFFYTIQREGSVRGVFVGHDHVNDYYGNLHGVTLGYGRVSGYNTYPREGLEPYGLEAGARVFMLRPGDGAFQTYIATAGGGTIFDQPAHEPERKS